MRRDEPVTTASPMMKEEKARSLLDQESEGDEVEKSEESTAA
jgi:hypothetical protein